MSVNEAGQYRIDVSDFPGSSPCENASAASHDQTIQPEHPEPVQDIPECPSASTSVKFNYHRDKPKDFWEIRPGDRIVIRHHLKPRKARFTPCHTQCPVDVNDLQPFRCTHVSVVSQEKEYQVCDSWTDSQTAHMTEASAMWKGKTVLTCPCSHPTLTTRFR